MDATSRARGLDAAMLPLAPTDRDVLFGRGKVIYSHPGNVRLLHTARRHRAAFQACAKRKDKRALAHAIVDEIHSNGGRFLMEHPRYANNNASVGGKVWTLAGEDKAVGKVMHSLREKERGDDEPADNNQDNIGGRTATNGAGASSASPEEGGSPSSRHNSSPHTLRNDDASRANGQWSATAKNGAGAASSSPMERGSPTSSQNSVQHSLPSEGASRVNGKISADAGPLGPLEASGSKNCPMDGKPSVATPSGHAAGGSSVGVDFQQQPQPLSRGHVQVESSAPFPVRAAEAPSASAAAQWAETKPPPGAHWTAGMAAARGAVGAAAATVREVPSGPITIGEWIERTKVSAPNKYIVGAVELAHKIARHVSELVEGGTHTITAADATAENVMLFVDPSTQSPSVRQVKFWRERSEAQTPAGNGAGLQSREACAALGQILLQLFSFGRSGSEESSALSTDSANNGKPPAQKRRARNGPAPTAADALLLAAGMPLSIRRLVCDLLAVATNEHRPNATALASLEEALWDIAQMRKDPQSFLWDRTRPEQALDRALGTDEHLFGRETELAALLDAKHVTSAFVGTDGGAASGRGNDFLCEVELLSGYSGSGKSSLLHAFGRSCADDGWFVVECKFSKQAAIPMVMIQSLDDFFGRRGQASDSPLDPSVLVSFQKVCERIFSTLDDEGFNQLCDFMPNFWALFPTVSRRPSNERGQGQEVSSMDKVGAARKRLLNLIHIVIYSICSVGRPVLFVFDDLQWAEDMFLEGFSDFLLNFVQGASSINRETNRCGLLVAGSFRCNEVKESDPLKKSIKLLEEANNVNVSTLAIGSLTKADVTRLISAKLCLPWRYTQELAGVVHTKTKGNPFFIAQFLRTIVSNKMLEFSVRSRRWEWDCDVVDMQMISDGVAQLLAATFSQLPSMLMKCMKIISCLGSQVQVLTVQALDSTNDVLSFNMLDQLQLAVKEGILEKAGPVYQFTHDIVQHTIYELIARDSRSLLHKKIGTSLLKSASSNPTIHLLAVDQINIFCKDGSLSPEERSTFAKCNAQAAKYAMAESNFDKARSYIDMGIRLLEPNHWETQYPLSLELYEMSASVSCISGDISTMSTCLEAVLSHVMTFEDSLNASSMLAKLLASNSKYADARGNCLDILSKLGEEFPADVGLPVVESELPAMQAELRGITVERMRQLPRMTDRKKLFIMKFLDMLCMYSVQSKPMLLPVLSHRMVRLTLEHGFCDNSIVGIATAGYSAMIFAEDFQLASHIWKVSEALIKKSRKRHTMRSRLCQEVFMQKAIKDPWQAVVAGFPELYNSAMMVGDVENAMICRWSYCGGAFWSSSIDLAALSNQMEHCIEEAAKYQQNTMLYLSMSYFNACTYLVERNFDNEFQVKSLDELVDIGERTNSLFLLSHVFMCRVSNLFWFREYATIAELSEEYSAKHPSVQQKRILHIGRMFYEGIAFLSLARSTRQAKWRARGEAAVKGMMQLKALSQWNFEHKSALLQAELHYLNGDLDSAEAAYEASIKSALAHKFVNEGAYAHELYGMCCIETGRREKGTQQLRSAVVQYLLWGATKKANALQRYIVSIAGA